MNHILPHTRIIFICIVHINETGKVRSLMPLKVFVCCIRREIVTASAEQHHAINT